MGPGESWQFVDQGRRRSISVRGVLSTNQAAAARIKPWLHLHPQAFSFRAHQGKGLPRSRYGQLLG